MMSTTKLYQQDVYTKEWDAEIVNISNNNVYLSATAFFPEGGGQSCDLGTVIISSNNTSKNNKKSRGEFNEYIVRDVQEDGENVAHTIVPAQDSGDALPAEFPYGLKVGDSVHCKLDWERRFDNMQRHCGEHILSGIFYRECGGVNRGFHMGEEYMTIDISLEDEPGNPEMTRPSEITREMAAHCELLANEVIWSDAPVFVFRYDDRADAEKMPLRKALAFDEDISIVCVGSPENAADCVACCGTHPSTAGQVGLIKIFKLEKYKDMFRIYFEAGRRALKDFGAKHDMLTDLSNRYSTSIEDFPSKIRTQEERLASLKGDLVKIKKVLIEGECSNLDALLNRDEFSNIDGALLHSKKLSIYSSEHLTLDDVFNMAKEYMGQDRCQGKLLLLYSILDTSYILVSDGQIKCGALVKEYAGFYKGKGGGSDVGARAIFSSSENAALFADLLVKHMQ